jgi:hypothetical protein
VQRGLFVNLASGRPSRLTEDDRRRFEPYVVDSTARPVR